MQPTPRAGPPRAGPPRASMPNMTGRIRPQKHATAVTATMPPPTQPITDPFAFGRAPPPMAAGGLPTIPNSSPPQMQTPPNAMYSQLGSGLPPQPQLLENVPAAVAGPPAQPLSGVTLFTPQGTPSAGVFPSPSPTGYASANSEQDYFNSRDPTATMSTDASHTSPAPSNTLFNQDFQAHHLGHPLPFQPLPTSSSSTQWAPDHSSRPPSVQNYFQPTVDPPARPSNIPPQTQMYPSHSQSPHHSAPTPQAYSGHPQIHPPAPLQNPVAAASSLLPDPNGPQHLNSHFQTQSYFSQSSAPHDLWFNQPVQDAGYHQMGTGLSHHQPPIDSTGSPHVSSTGPSSVCQPGPSSVPVTDVYGQESGTISMFFKGSDVENEETLADERNKTLNGVAGSFQNNSNPPSHSSHSDLTVDYHGVSVPDHSRLPYMNESSHPLQGHIQKLPDNDFDHVENLECVPNQEVLPNEFSSGAAAAIAACNPVDQFETGPNLETPDSVPRPMRSASVSSNYSNLSHGSGTDPRRHQGVEGTFIQQESPRLADNPNTSSAAAAAAAGGYFEQIDTSPSGDVGVQGSVEHMWHPTPSPPKPTGIFQASANSSFEPVRSHGVGVRPAEVDRAKMVAEGGSDSISGNLEQPPDNMENIYGPGQASASAPGDVLSSQTHSVVHPHSRPSSRAFGANRPCESPATTLWAQNDPTSLGTNILLAPAAPPVLAPLREPSADVIQPPEDCPLDLQASQRVQTASQQHSENLENPPKVSDAEPADSQSGLGYASLLVSGSLHQPVLIAPPVSNYSVIPPSIPTPSSTQTNHGEVVSPERPPAQGLGASISLPSALPSKQNPLFSSGSAAFCSSAPNQGPLNLTRDKTVGATSEITTPPLSQPVHPPLSRGQSLGAESHSTVNSQPVSLMTASVSNHNQTLNYELLDFSMHQSHGQSQAYGQPSSLHESSQSSNGFYLQVTKDAQQGVRDGGNLSIQTVISTSTSQAPPGPPPAAPNTQQTQSEPPKTSNSQVALQGQRDAPAVPVSGAQPSQGQYSTPAQGPAGGNAPPPAAPGVCPPGTQGAVPQGDSQAVPAEAPRPPSSAGSHQGYVHPPPPPGSGQMYSSYYGNYGEYADSRGQYPPGQYPPPPGDPRMQQYYQDANYRGRGDPWYGRYDGQNPGYRDPNYQYREPQSDRPSSRTSQYSDRPSSRQGYSEDYQRQNRSAYGEYYADYPKHYDYRGYNYGQYDQRYRGYYDQSYWSYYNDAYRNGYYNQQYPSRKDGYDDQWQYYPGYDRSFDDDNVRGRDPYGDDFDRRSVHSERSAHSVHSSTSHHSRRSSFSSRSQQSQVYRSQPDLVSAVYDTTQSTLPVDYSYGQYPNQTDATQNYSQYMYPSEYTADSTWIAPEQPPPRPATPEKFTMPHRCARFGPGGHLIQVLPNLPSAGQPALVEIHNMETMLQDTADQAELRGFPGPLIKEETHKVDVIKFSQNKAMECSRDNNLLDRDSARLLWDFIVLLCRQNGTVVGTDIADLLLKEHRSVWLPGKSPNEANLIDFNNEPLARAEEEPGAGPLSLLSDTFMIVPENIGKETERFRELLLFGRKKDALEAAMKGGLWGHALLLASKMDNRTHARVMTRFANSLPMNDPLQTMYQLMSGRMPASATCCGEEKWGDWRPHLAMVLSNLTHNMDLDTRTITTMGDTLASKGLTDAAHFCYLMAQVGLGVYTKKSTKLVLLGSNHSLAFTQFATNEAIQRTEAYEYAQSLGSQPCSLPNFQVFKLIYACRLAESGLSAQAFHYCEVIAKTVLMHASYYSPVFISQIIQMSEKLRFFDPQLKERPEQELFIEPEWLIRLKQLDGQIRTGVITYNRDRSTPAQFDCISESSDLEPQSPPEPYSMHLEVDGQAPDNQLMSSLMPGPQPQAVQLMPPAPSSILHEGVAPAQLPPSSDVPQFYPVSPSGPPGQIPMPGFPPQDPGVAHPPFHHQHEQAYLGAHQQFVPSPQEGQMSPHMFPSQVPHSPVQMTHPPFQMPQHMPPSPGHMAPMEQPPPPHPEMHPTHPISSSPRRSSFTPQMDLYDHMAIMGPRRSRTTSQSSMHLPSGRSSRRASESSTHSGGRERSNSAVKQASPPPPSIPEQPRKEEARKAKKDSPEKSKGWSFWPFGKRKNEAHLPDDKNPSIVWDEKKNRWVDLNEPEEESKPPPPPPTGFPKMPQMPGPGGPTAPPGAGSAVNMFSRKAGTRSRYVDVLNPSGTAKPSGVAPAPVDLFAPLAPMPMPANLFVPSSAPSDQQPREGSEGGNQEQNSPSSSAPPQVFNPTLLPPAPEGPPVPDGSQSGELSRSSSMSSLSREVSQHLNQSHPNQGTTPAGGVTFYNPTQFSQTSAPSGGGQRSSRLGQRQYPVYK